MGIAFAPDQLRRVEGGNNIEEESRAGLDRTQHEERDRPFDGALKPAREVAIIERDDRHQDQDAPEGHLMNDVRDSDAGKREELCQGCSGAKHLAHGRQRYRHQGAARRLRLVLFTL